MSKYRHEQSMTMTCQNGCSTLCKHPQSLQRRPGQTLQLNSLGTPRPQKGGRHLQYLGAEFCRFLVWFGQSTFALRCDQKPSIFFFWLETAIRIIKGISKGKRKSKDTPRAKGKTEVTRAGVSPARAPLVLQLPALSACTAASMATSSVTT